MSGSPPGKLSDAGRDRLVKALREDAELLMKQLHQEHAPNLTKLEKEQVRIKVSRLVRSPEFELEIERYVEACYDAKLSSDRVQWEFRSVLTSTETLYSMYGEEA